ncbi:MAG: EAL domain-containing protein [Oscillospiraceae bacterium]|nr:EAL domain-containing protein [Oscillospiraceae bacterium]
MLKRKLNKILLFLLVSAVMICSVPLASYAADKGETVRVGACPDFGISKVGGEYSGFAYDYLAEIQKHTGHRYTFIEATPDELIDMLLEGIIDVIPCVSAAEYQDLIDKYYKTRTADEIPIPQLCSVSLMRKYTAIYISENSETDISYFDTQALNKATIGYLSENQSKYFSDNTFIRGDIDQADYIEYSTEAQMQMDFNSGKIDAVIKQAFRPWNGEKIVYQYDTKDCYFLVSGKDSLLANQLNVAMNSIHMSNSSFAQNTYKNHIEKYGSPRFAYSKEEKAFVKENPLIKVAYNISASSIEDFDGQNIVGYTQTIINAIEDYSGFEIELRSCPDLEECVRLLENGEVQAICGGVNAESMETFGKFRISSSYDDVPIVIAAKQGTVLSNSMKIAIPYNGDDISHYAVGTYTNATLLPYENTEKCLEAVRNGDADCMCADAYETIYLLNDKYNDIEIAATCNDLHKECFAYVENAPAELSNILGKAITAVGKSNALVEYYTKSVSANKGESLHTVRIEVVYIAAATIILIAAGAILFMAIVKLRSKRANEIDPLTGGRNRIKFIEDTQKLIRKTSAEKWALVLFDINKFKFVNDRLGYEEGDRLLERLYKTVSDNIEDDEVFARISDDNFACVIKNTQDQEITTRLHNIFDEFDRRNSLFVKYPVAFSTGVCRLGQCRDGNGDIDINAALDRCKIAKRTLKGLHYSSIAFYDGSIRDKALREKDYENIMPSALEQREFECYLQPKYGLKSRHIEGAEALIRWNSKEFGFVFPNEFIPISEKNGFVVELDFFILEEVCRAMRRWLNEGKTPVVVSVNQSRLHLNYDDYIWRLREIVDKYEIPYEYIELELTESVFMENAEKLLAIMQKLHDIGFKLSLDDFGSGYSSLNMLKDIPVDVVKIDREFFNGTVNSEKGRAVISTVVELAANLNMEVISEGVETKEQVDFLADINCAMVQGYYFAKPMTIESFEELWDKDTLQKNSEAADTQ